MAFTSKSFTKAHGYPSDSDAMFNIWKYRSLTDTMGTILAADYFATYGDELNVGDIIHIIGTDGYGDYRVTAASSTSVSVQAYAGGGASVVTVSSAELLALAASPKTLVAAPGAGLVARFHSIDLFLDFNTTAYTITAGGDDLAVRYTDGSGAIVSQTLQSADFLDATADAYLQGQAVDEVGGDLADFANQALVLDNIGANEFTLGDSPVYAKVRYEIVTVPF